MTPRYKSRHIPWPHVTSRDTHSDTALQVATHSVTPPQVTTHSVTPRYKSRHTQWHRYKSRHTPWHRVTSRDTLRDTATSRDTFRDTALQVTTHTVTPLQIATHSVTPHHKSRHTHTLTPSYSPKTCNGVSMFRVLWTTRLSHWLRKVRLSGNNVSTLDPSLSVRLAVLCMAKANPI